MYDKTKLLKEKGLQQNTWTTEQQNRDNNEENLQGTGRTVLIECYSIGTQITRMEKLILNNA